MKRSGKGWFLRPAASESADAVLGPYPAEEARRMLAVFDARIEDFVVSSDGERWLSASILEASSTPPRRANPTREEDPEIIAARKRIARGLYKPADGDDPMATRPEPPAAVSTAVFLAWIQVFLSVLLGLFVLPALFLVPGAVLIIAAVAILFGAFWWAALGTWRGHAVAHVILTVLFFLGAVWSLYQMTLGFAWGHLVWGVVDSIGFVLLLQPSALRFLEATRVHGTRERPQVSA